MTGTDPISTSVVQHDGVAVLAVAGEIDLATAPSFEEAISEALADEPPGLIIDLSGVTFLASVGLQILVLTKERVGTATDFGVVADGPSTSRPIELTELDKIFDLYPTLDEALEAVRRKPRLL